VQGAVIKVTIKSPCNGDNRSLGRTTVILRGACLSLEWPFTFINVEFGYREMFLGAVVTGIGDVIAQDKNPNFLDHRELLVVG
jgi:hypothetical protein